MVSQVQAYAQVAVLLALLVFVSSSSLVTVTATASGFLTFLALLVVVSSAPLDTITATASRFLLLLAALHCNADSQGRRKLEIAPRPSDPFFHIQYVQRGASPSAPPYAPCVELLRKAHSVHRATWRNRATSFHAHHNAENSLMGCSPTQHVTMSGSSISGGLLRNQAHHQMKFGNATYQQPPSKNSN